MAISAPHYRCLRELHRRGELPQEGLILEIGEANFYGDIPIADIAADVDAITGGDWRAEDFKRRLREACDSQDLFAIAKVIYRLFFRTNAWGAFDMNGTDDAYKVDLNLPVPVHFFSWGPDPNKKSHHPTRCETVINHGTAEHIFNIGQVFRTMHDRCAVGGLMIHESPFTGWIDHGFWTIQPTAYFDLCAANNYKLVYMAVTCIEANAVIEIFTREQLLQMAERDAIPSNSMLFVAMRKQDDTEFRIPMQGVYNGTLSDEARAAWSALR